MTEDLTIDEILGETVKKGKKKQSEGINPASPESGTLYVRRGSSYRITNMENLQVESKLPPKNFQIEIDPMTKEYYLEPIKPFVIPKKIYGSFNKKAKRIITTYMDRSESTGVLFTGEKGSGKSMLAKLIAFECAKKHNMPCLVVNSAHYGEPFNAFIQSIDQPLMVLFDEFEKVYEKDEQPSMLTLLDGTYPSKKLFVLTCNDKYRVDEHMLNRPGRIYYSISFVGMDEDEIREYCEEQLDDKEQIEPIVKFSRFFGSFNFDILKAIVEEMNRYKEPVAEAYKMLNADPNNDDNKYKNYDITLFDAEGKELEISWPESTYGAPFQGNNRRTAFDITYIVRHENPKKGQEAEEHVEVSFIENDIELEECVNGKFVFVNKKGFKSVFEPREVKIRDYSLLV